MKTTRLVLLATLLLLVSCQQASPIPTTGEVSWHTSQYDRAILAVMEKWAIPGGALAAARDGKLVLARGYGFADVEQGELAQPDSLFRIASISKPITAVAILQLVEQGKLDLDGPVFDVLDSLAPAAGATTDPRLREITIRQLLEHTGGWDRSTSFDPMFNTSTIAAEFGSPGPAECRTVIRYMLGLPLDFDPGTRYAYSNFGYCVLGRVIEEVSGQAYEAYVTDHVLRPVGIEDMRLGRSRLSDRQPGEVHYYDQEGAPLTQPIFRDLPDPVPVPYGGFHLEAMDSHGGWIASATDLVRFVVALDTGRPATVLQPQTLAEMLAPPNPLPWEDSGIYYGLGWNVQPVGDEANWWHTGSLPGTMTFLYRASNGLTWAALFNTRPESSEDELILELFAAMGWANLVTERWWVCPVGIVVLIGAIVTAVMAARGRGLRAARADALSQRS
jgi:N-acyl-D-amino-acid deacylase